MTLVTMRLPNKNIYEKTSSPHSDFHKCRAIKTGAGAIIGPKSACMGEGEKEGEDRERCEEKEEREGE